MVIDGKAIATNISEHLRERVTRLSSPPLFCDILVGDDLVQRSYVSVKGKAAQRIGITFSVQNYPADTPTDVLLNEIGRINLLPSISGLIIQLPLPGMVDTIAVLNAIDPRIDVDCIGQHNSSLFYRGEDVLHPPTAAAVLKVLDSIPENFRSKRFVIVGQGPLVGKPVTFLLKRRGLHVSIADKSTPNTEELIQQADVIISATGQPGLIQGKNIKPGAIVIDAGTSEVDGGITGDVEFDSVSKIASWISPVPGGVGPVTVAELLSNVVQVAEQKELTKSK